MREQSPIERVSVSFSMHSIYSPKEQKKKMSKSNSKVVVVGTYVIDFFTYSSRLPKPGETILGKKYEQCFGGKGANQCVAAARLGASSVFIAALGDDSLGHRYLEQLKKESIDVSHVKIKENAASGVATITVSDTGENTIVMVFDPAMLSQHDVLRAKEKIQSAAVLLLQFEISLELTLEALKLFKGHGGVSIVNGAPAVRNIDPDIFKLSDIFCVNETEAEVITGLDNLTVKDAQTALDKLLSFGCNTVIITFGSQGAVFASQSSKNVVHVPADPVKAVDTTGAGDSFLGALAYFLANHPNLPLAESIRRSNKIAAQSVMKNGTQTSFPYRKDLSDDLFQL